MESQLTIREPRDVNKESMPYSMAIFVVKATWSE
jgi:hypothetical protein